MLIDDRHFCKRPGCLVLLFLHLAGQLQATDKPSRRNADAVGSLAYRNGLHNLAILHIKHGNLIGVHVGNVGVPAFTVDNHAMSPGAGHGVSSFSVQ